MNIQKSVWNTLRLRRKVCIGHLIRNSPRMTAIVGGKIKGKPEGGKALNSILEASDKKYRNGNKVKEKYRWQEKMGRETSIVIWPISGLSKKERVWKYYFSNYFLSIWTFDVFLTETLDICSSRLTPALPCNVYQLKCFFFPRIETNDKIIILRITFKTRFINYWNVSRK